MNEVWWDYLFEDEDEGEFLVEVEIKNNDKKQGLKEAKKIAHKYFNNPLYITDMSPTEGEMTGLDTF